MIFLFTPFILALWRSQSSRGAEPSTVSKMAYGCFLNAMSYLVLFAAAIYAGGGQGELDVAHRLFHHHHYRRALSVADRALAGVESGALALSLDDDGSLACDKFLWRLFVRISRQLLEQYG